MSFTLPVDFTITELVAVAFLLICWFFYSTILNLLSRGSLNQQLSTVRAQSLLNSISRAQKPFDAILLGHIVNSVAFFGSATLLVLATSFFSFTYALRKLIYVLALI